MKILLAPDKFKGSLSANEVCIALAEGLTKRNPNLEITALPLADGGDGSLEVLEHYLELKTYKLTVQDPLGRPILAAYKMHNSTAYIEMSAASGLVLLKDEERNCMKTSSFGTGELIADALQKGAKTIYLFIGGSATNDGGVGIAAALGYRFYDSFGNLLAPIGENLVLIERIDRSGTTIKLQEVLVKVICDVNNPFHGENGAAHVYAPQKGANPKEVIHLNNGLVHLAIKLMANDFPNIVDIPGAGAAGGVGGGAIAFLGAILVSGITTFLKLTELETAMKACDIVITGEGKLDAQTEQGKVISGVCALAKQYRKPVIAVCGMADKAIVKKLDFQKVYTIIEQSNSIQEAMEKAEEKLIEIGQCIFPS